MALHGVGIDVADVGRLARLVERGDSFTRRWFTGDEVAECEGSLDPASAYAGRFAAKEAVWKSLGVHGDGPVPWLSIAVLTGGARPAVTLSGDVAARAAAAGVGAIHVTISRSDEVTTAVAVAERSG